MLNFEDFLLEKLGYSTENKKITNYVINHLGNLDNVNSIKKININFDNTVNLKTVIIESIPYLSENKGKWGYFIPYRSTYSENGSEVYIIIDPYEITNSTLNHELFHSFEWLKNKGKHLINNEEMSVIGLYDYFIDKDDDISKIINIFYILSSPELKANYNEIIYELEENINDNNDDINIKKLIEDSHFFKEYNKIKHYNIKELISNLSKKQINEFISSYNLMKELKEGEERSVEIKNYSQNEINNFIKFLSNIFDKQILRYKKYINKLYSFFNL